MSFFSSVFGSPSTSESKPMPEVPAVDSQNGKAPKTVYYLGIIRPASGANGRSEELVADINVMMYNRYTRETYKEPLRFAAKLVAERTPIGQRQRVPEKGMAVYAYNTTSGFCAVLITNAWSDEDDRKYYDISAGSILSKVVDGFKTAFPANKIKTDPPSAFEWPKIADIRAEAEMAHHNGINATQRELDETKVILHRTIEQVLERGEKLDVLVAKSDDLSSLSKGFYKQSKAQNSCCVVM